MWEKGYWISKSKAQISKQKYIIVDACLSQEKKSVAADRIIIQKLKPTRNSETAYSLFGGD